jgi:hypothetical protein
MVKKKNNKNIENLEDIPDDSEQEIDSKELSILNNILNVKNNSPQEYNTLKYVIYATIIFIILSLPFVDRIFELAVPITQSWLILVGFKTVIFFIMYYIIFYINKNKIN